MVHISSKEMKIVLNIIKRYAEDCKVLVFGSRLKGTHTSFSDLDLAFICKNKIEFKKILKLKREFAESDLPYKVDVIDYNRTSTEFKAIIDRDNEAIYPNT